MSDHIVTVIIPLYNKEKYVLECINSVLSQDYVDFSIIVVDDCSIDGSLNAVKSIKDPRLKVYENNNNLGPAQNGNRCFELVETKYAIRIDADDVMPPGRIKFQVEYLKANQDVAVIAGINQIYGTQQKNEVLIDEEKCNSEFIFTNPISQGTAAFNMDFIRNNEVKYESNGPHVGEDWIFFYKLKKYGRLVNVNKVFNFYRQHNENISNIQNENYHKDIAMVLEFIFSDMGIEMNTDELEAHLLFRNSIGKGKEVDKIGKFYQWINKLKTENVNRKFINREYLDQRILNATNFLFYNICDNKDAIEEFRKYFKLDKVKKKYLIKLKIRKALNKFRNR